MNHTSTIRISNLRGVLISCGCLLAINATLAATPTNAPARPGKSGATNAALAAIVVPKSEFASDRARDPFFPNSKRVLSEVRSTSTNAVAVVATLVLQGVSDQAGRKYALINGRTFVEGETADITVGNTKTRVGCLQIRDRSAVVEVNGRQQELKLRSGA